jgi:hypothetical protein
MKGRSLPSISSNPEISSILVLIFEMMRAKVFAVLIKFCTTRFLVESVLNLKEVTIHLFIALPQSRFRIRKSF